MARLSGSKFLITELRRTGAGTLVATPVRFDWNAQNKAKPRAPVSIPQTLVTVREVPPGQDQPVEQVISVAIDPIEFQGKWDDKWGGPGFAANTLEAFRRMHARCSLVRLEWDDLSFQGLITSFTWDYWDESRVEYSFTLSTHTPAGANAPVVVPTIKPTRGRIDESKAIIARLRAEQEAARTVQFSDETYPDVGSELDSIDQVVSELDNENDTFGLIENAAEDLRRTSYRFNRLGSASMRTLNRVNGVRTDIQGAVVAASQAVRLDVWSRAMAANARLLLLKSLEAEDDLESRAESSPDRLYRPHAGETVYHVAAQATGSSANWRAIVKANRLGDKFAFDGTEELVIPREIVQSD